MVTLREITRENFWDCINLKVGEDQKGFVASNAVSLAQSKYQPECIPLAIYNDDVMVGFVMYCIDADDHNYWIYRMMIDQAHQRKGYGEEAMRLVIAEISKDASRSSIYLDCKHENAAAQRLYAKVGFVKTDGMDDQEVYMRLDYR